MATHVKDTVLWWKVTLRRGPKKKIQKTIRADNVEEAKILSLPFRDDVILSAKQIKGPEYIIEQARHSYDVLDLYEAIGNCAGLLKATVPLDRALLLQLSKAKSPHLRYYIYKAVRLIRNGEKMADAFASIPKMCDRKLIALIRVAEESDKMEVICEQMKVDTKKRRKIIGRTKSAAIYPYIVSWIVALVFTFFSFSLIPKMDGLYKSFHAPLPWFSAIVFAFALFFKKWAVLTIPAMIATLVTVWRKKEVFFRRPWVVRIVYSLPGIGEFTSKNEFMTTVKSLAMLLTASVPLDKAMDISEDVIVNNVMKKVWHKIGTDVREAKGISDSFARYADQLGPCGPDLAAIIQIGEEGSKMEEVLFEYASDLENEVDQQSEDIQKLIEPLLMTVMSVVVGGLLISIYYPIITLGQAFSQTSNGGGPTP